MWNLELTAKTLSTCGQDTSTWNVVAELGINHDKAFELVSDLVMSGLLERTIQRNGRGRPRHILHTTPLGDLFLSRHNELMSLRFRSNDNDIRKAIRNAEQTQRLLDRGVSPYARFQELNRIARNIARSTQAR